MIDEIVNYCNKQYQLKSGKCMDCSNVCNSSCYKCLKDIHFDSNCHRSYDCEYMRYHYVCQDMHRYATEMAYLWNVLFKNIKWVTSIRMNICSIGCGPCTELVAFEEYCVRNNIQIPFLYRGFDLGDNWAELQNVAKQYAPHPNSVFFENCDVFDYYSNVEEKPNVIVLNYLLSNMQKNAPLYIDEFVCKLSDLFESLPYGVLLINDINYSAARKYYDQILQECLKHDEKGHAFFQMRFKDTSKNYYYYGNKEWLSSDLLFNVTKDLCNRYYTSTECHSAQLVITQKNKNL